MGTRDGGRNRSGLPGQGDVLQSAQGGDRAGRANTALCGSRHQTADSSGQGQLWQPSLPPDVGQSHLPAHTRASGAGPLDTHQVLPNAFMQSGNTTQYRPRKPPSAQPHPPKAARTQQVPGPARPRWTAHGRPQPGRVASHGQGPRSMRRRASWPPGGPLPLGTLMAGLARAEAASERGCFSDAP